MNTGPELTTTLFALAGAALGVLTAVALRPKARTLAAACLGGLAVSIFDVFGVVVAHRMDWWHLQGAWMLGPVPLVLNAAWIFLGAGYCLVYERLARRAPPARRVLLVPLTAAIGVGNDGLLRHLGVLSLGEGMRLAYTYPYWLMSITLTLVVFGLASSRSAPPAPAGTRG
ncbi:MAG: DUF2878 family protein [Nitrospirae bacterium]|nr:DUF2878 family protein [Nitrospirota bacterium]